MIGKKQEKENERQEGNWKSKIRLLSETTNK